MGFDNQKLLESLLCRMMKHVAPPKGLAEDLPMQYAGFPVRVCVNDQLDRFSAPIENRYTRAHVEGWLKRAGLNASQVRANLGWVGTGRK
jgi:hypothetical protein